MRNCYFDPYIFKKFVDTCVDEMYPMEKGVAIFDFQASFHIYDGRLSRRQIKHIIEQRKSEGKPKIEIKNLFYDIPETIMHADFEMPNTNLRYPGSIMRLKAFNTSRDGVIVILDKKTNQARDIITAFSRSSERISTMKKKLDASAAGETPRP